MKRQRAALLVIAAAVGVFMFYKFVVMSFLPAGPVPAAAANAGLEAHPPMEGVPSRSNVNQSYMQQVDELKRSVEQNPGNVHHLRVLATLLMDGHQAAEAIPYFERASRLQPQNDSLLLDLSVCYSIVKKYDAALRVTERILQHDGKNLAALYNKGALFATMGRNEDAARAWKKIVALDPSGNDAQKARSGLAAIGK